ncbi:hypothetical protein K458DRAFT_179190 [Lentithecium fluviatile CBS 122367]|uniref:Uncharacterized protein n=1 Tax=Lentithecium fluviatile CBS 122367 TaxID=1168545 RepID=A0A6G1IFH9_9PLEO|nr:hypothetical protein K458DRAFT_179190 [Lentithecium fluviatile CBS 122367]
MEVVDKQDPWMGLQWDGECGARRSKRRRRGSRWWGPSFRTLHSNKACTRSGCSLSLPHTGSPAVWDGWRPIIARDGKAVQPSCAFHLICFTSFDYLPGPAAAALELCWRVAARLDVSGFPTEVRETAS